MSKAILLGSNDADVYYSNGDALRQPGRQTEVQQAYEKAQQLCNEH